MENDTKRTDNAHIKSLLHLVLRSRPQARYEGERNRIKGMTEAVRFGLRYIPDPQDTALIDDSNDDGSTQSVSAGVEGRRWIIMMTGDLFVFFGGQPVS
jgi:hypothetical protein